MNTGLKYLIGALMAGAMALPASAAGAKDDLSKPAGKDWPAVGGSWSNARYSTLRQVDVRNVKKLGGAWMHKFEGESSRASPVIADGKLFITAGTHVYAFNPATGAQIWAYKAETAPSGMYKGVAVGDGRVYVGLGNGHMIALDEKTGKLDWTGIVGDNPPLKGQAIPAGPTYVDGLVVTGLANGDYGLDGRIDALDAKTGKLVWRFDTIPPPGKPGHETWASDNDEWKKGGGGVWMNAAVDADLGLVYLGVGNPVPQWGGELRAGDNLYTDTAVALDLKTGKPRWHYQVVHHDIWEQDLGTPLVLFDYKMGGKTHKAVGVMRTDGYLFILDRATGKPLWPVEERPVPQNPRLKTAPTQPFPKGAEAIGPNCEPKDQIPAGFKALCEFEPVDYDTPNGMYPILTTRSSPMAYSPQTGYFYAAGSPGWPLWIKRFQDPKFFLAGNAVPGIKTKGVLAAVDSKTNKIVWKKISPYEMQNGSGVTATAGGLIFHGDPDGNVQALDAKTGDLLWQFQTGSNASGPVAVYEVGGQEYLALASRGALWAFKLGGDLKPLPPPPPPPTETGFAGRVVRTDHIEMSPTISDTGLEFVRHVVDEYAYSPVRTKVKVGTKVTWTNKGKLAHDASAVDGSWSTGEVQPGQSATVTFDKPGTYTYHCKDHPWSYGELIVQ